ncbi:MAG: hypothetical protein M1822_004217 [Bathelium mastoideum]|nr:MAG: hypothetical protein M1822_004217 [Bathelium mastoideum]
MAQSSGIVDRRRIPILYRFVFLYLEPISVLIGAYLALFRPTTYLTAVHALPPSADLSTAPTKYGPTVNVLLAQLANVYILFPLLERSVLGSTQDVRVWRAMLRALLVADVGHLLIVGNISADVGLQLFVRLREIGLADWAKPLCMIIVRTAFLCGWGLLMERNN